MNVPCPAYGRMFLGSKISGSPVTPFNHGLIGSVAAASCQPVSTTDTNTPLPSPAFRVTAGNGSVVPGSSGSVAGQHRSVT